MIRRFLCLIFAVSILLGCTKPKPVKGESPERKPKTLTYLALGDSYTIGESVDPSLRWPTQLVNLLRANEVAVEDAVIIAKTGWTTDELDRAIDEAGPGSDFDLVTLLIGVNNQYRGMDSSEYRSEFNTLLQRAIGFAKGDASRVVVVSIPDWGVTPFAAERDRGEIAREIDEFNAINREEAESSGAAWVDVTNFSRQAGEHSAMSAEDGLHPSGMQYSEWARLILPAARSAIELRSMTRGAVS